MIAPAGAEDGRGAVGSALANDARAVLENGPFRAFAAVWLVAAGYQLIRRGPEMIQSVALIAAGGVLFALAVWLVGRHPWANPAADPVRAPRAEATAVGIAFVGLAIWFFGGGWIGFRLFQLGLLAWLLVVLAARYRPRDLAFLVRTWQPYLPLVLALLLPKVALIGADVVPRTLGGLESGIIQQLLLQIGLTSRIEALTGRSDVAIVAAGLLFGLVHVPLDLGHAGGDWSLAFSNGTILQGLIGVLFCAAYVRHRAVLGLGFCHALLMV